MADMTPAQDAPVRRLGLSKYEATANDFLVVDDLDRTLDGCDLAGVARAVCDRHVGIGADGLIRMLPPTEAESDCSMELHNADGSRAEMSGNGIRTLALAARRKGLGTEHELRVDTDAGLKTITFAEAVSPAKAASGQAVESTVAMGEPTFDPAEIPFTGDLPIEVELDGKVVSGIPVGMGNPHLVLFVDDPSAVDLDLHGAVLEHDERFPRRTNVEFVRVTDGDLELRVWERGASETLSCGTGACASAAAAHRMGRIGTSSNVNVPGGRLSVRLDGTAFLTGPARWIADIKILMPGAADD